MSKKTIIAGVQMDVRILEKSYNLGKTIAYAQEAQGNGAKIVIFPELALTGYCFSSLEEAIPISEPIPGPSTNIIHKICKELDILILIGLIETENKKYFNSSALLGPNGLIGKYRKIHLPFIGLDRFVFEGDIPFKVYDTKSGIFGWVICYDASFPESIRVLTLGGAELVAVITNWPEGGETAPKFMVPARAIENHINYIAVNRIGSERGFRFIGQSKIVDYVGKTLAEAGSDKEEIIYSEIDLEKARDKRTVIIPGEFEVDRIKDRRPKFYKPLIDPTF
jgi:predicted amidohydrolase